MEAPINSDLDDLLADAVDIFRGMPRPPLVPRGTEVNETSFG
jgi:hypothetical protein